MDVQMCLLESIGRILRYLVSSFKLVVELRLPYSARYHLRYVGQPLSQRFGIGIVRREPILVS